MRHILILLLFFLSFSVGAQNFENTWKGFFSYVSIKAISEGNNKLFVAAENSVFTYDVNTQEISTISTVNGLSGEVISSIYYSENFGVLVVGYENGLLDVIIDGEENILTVVDILDKPAIPPNEKQINNFYEYNGNLYISAGFGISLFDLTALEFGDTYFIGNLGAQINITQTTVLGDYIYASSSEQGVKRALVDNENLIDFEQWEALTVGNVQGVQTLGEEVYIARSNRTIDRYIENVGFENITTLGGPILDFKSIDNILTVTTTQSIVAYSLGLTVESVVNNTLPDFDFRLQSGISLDNNFYLGTTENGMLIVPYGTNQPTQILPDGPILNKPFAIDASPGQLWVSFGDISARNNPFPLSSFGISNLRDSTWTNIPFSEINEGNTGNRPVTDIVDVTINPNNPSEVYFSSYIGGLLKINDLTPEIIYNETNSNLEEAIVTVNNQPANAGIRLYGSNYDRQGDLWIAQSLFDEGLLKQTSPGQFQKIDLTPIIEPKLEQAIIDLKVSREGYVFMSTANNGVIGYNPTDGTYGRITEGEGNGNLPRKNARAIEFDRQNRLWIGTSRGLRVLFNVGAFFEEEEIPEAQEIIILQDGIPQELLFQQTITDIEVDGSNNKWIGTATSGVFYVSPNGQETLLRFTKENSPLPSNTIQDITIDESTGRVYFATVNGLVAFEGTATAPQDNLENVYAFPNPVRPGYTGDVTIDGLTARANVKITDIEGNLVFETTSQGGSVLWDTTAFGQYRVASGVYLVLITTDDALETKIHKIMVVR